MTTFAKDVISAGRYHLKDGRVVSYTPAEVRQMHRRAGEMLAAGLHIPVAWNHQEDTTPVSEGDMLAAKARNVLGHVTDATMERGDTLTTLFDVASADDAGRLPSIKYVSPEIRRDWVDGTGRKWPGLSITHLAVTGNPVNPHQRPFRRAERLSLDVVRLSLDDLQEGENVAAEDDDKAPKKTEGEGEGGDATIGDVMDALREGGMSIPDEVVDFRGLIIAIKASGPAPPDADVVPPEEPITEEPGAVMMSMDVARNPLAARLVRGEREGLVRRARALVGAGKVDKPTADKLAGDLTAERLSLDARAELVGGKALARLEAYEALPARRLTGFTRLSNDGGIIHEEPAPDDVAREATDKESRKLASSEAARVSVGGGKKRA